MPAISHAFRKQGVSEVSSSMFESWLIRTINHLVWPIIRSYTSSKWRFIYCERWRQQLLFILLKRVYLSEVKRSYEITSLKWLLPSAILRGKETFERRTPEWFLSHLFLWGFERVLMFDLTGLCTFQERFVITKLLANYFWSKLRQRYVGRWIVVLPSVVFCCKMYADDILLVHCSERVNLFGGNPAIAKLILFFCYNTRKLFSCSFWALRSSNVTLH